MVRDCTLDDVTWLVKTAEVAYAELLDEYNQDGAAAWCRACVLSAEMITVRDDGVAAFAALGRDPWAPNSLYCDLVHLFGKSTRQGETLGVLAAVNERRKAMGARRMYVGSIYRDLSLLARRLGGRPLNTAYVIEG